MNTLPQTLQSLPPKWAHFCLNIEAFLLDRVDPLADTGIVVACSGGLDSTALLLALACLRERSRFRLMAAHLDHGLRPESDQDALFVAELAAKLNITLVSEKTDVAAFAKSESMGIEEAGRIVRYDFLATVRQMSGYNWVATGHHADDLMEDVLLRLIRGSGWPALSGMVAVDENRNLLRPFLLTKKKTLQSFLEDLDVQWREDASNDDLAFTRNRVRHTLLPLILKENPNFHIATARLWTQGEMDQDFFAQAIEHIAVIRTEHGPELKLNDLASIHPTIRIRLYKKLLDELGPGQALADTLFELDAGVARGESPKPACFQFPGNKEVRIKGRQITFRITPSNAP